MVGGPTLQGARRAVSPPPRPRVRALAPEELAWLLAAPCALVTVALVVLLGPPLGHRFLAPGSEAFFPNVSTKPEPVEHARYLLALLGPVLLSGAVLALSRRRPRLHELAIRALAWGNRLVVVAVLLACLAAENDIVLHTYVSPYTPDRFFNHPTLAIAALLPLLMLLGLRSRRAVDWVARVVRETGPRRVAGLAIAATLTAVWLLTAIDSDRTIGSSLDSGWSPWPLNETFAVLDGRTPLVNFHTLYGELWPYPIALVLALVGTTLTAWTTTMATISGLAMLSVFATFRRIVRSSLLALTLYVPFLAISFFISAGSREHRLSPASIFALWPIRYAGPYLVAWLTARHLDRLRPRRAWLLFLVGGLVALNNPEFGVGAVAGTFVALACRYLPHSRAAARHLLASAASGLLGAVALVSLLTLARTGQLPRFGLLLEYARLFGLGGLRLAPMRPFGMHIAAYITFASAIVTAVVRTRRGREDAVLTGLLAWSGTFGLIAGSYYVGESEGGSMLSLFSAWFFSLGLLAVVVVRGLAARSWRRPRLVELAVLFGFALAFSSIPQIPSPWAEIARLQRHTATPIFKQPEAVRFVARATRRGEQVAILIPIGHRIAYDLGLVNVSPYVSTQSILTRQMLQTTIDVVRAAHVRKVFIGNDTTSPEQLRALVRAGFRARATTTAAGGTTTGYQELVDTAG